MKNCEDIIADAIDQTFMTELILVSSGSAGKENSIEATRLISEWNQQFNKSEKCHVFGDAFNSLRQSTDVNEAKNPISDTHETKTYEFFLIYSIS